MIKLKKYKHFPNLKKKKKLVKILYKMRMNRMLKYICLDYIGLLVHFQEFTIAIHPDQKLHAVFNK